MTRPKPDENVIEGRWLAVGGKVVGDEAASRIDKLIADYLSFVAVSADGWSKLFRDPKDGRLWEHTYPQSEMHGGGPPRLGVISLEAARPRYPNGHEEADQDRQRTTRGL